MKPCCTLVMGNTLPDDRIVATLDDNTYNLKISEATHLCMELQAALNECGFKRMRREKQHKKEQELTHP